MDAATVRAAIQALYGQDSSESARANSYLMEVLEQPAAWGVCLELLSTPGAAVTQYFGANMLYTKVRRHWHELDAEHRSQLPTAILRLLRGEGGIAHDRVVQHRLCLVLAAVGVRVPNGVDIVVAEAFRIAESGAAAGSSPGRGGSGAAGGPNAAADGTTAATQTALLMLSVLPEEASGADISRSHRVELQEALRSHVPRVLQAVGSVAAGAAAAMPYVPPGNGNGGNGNGGNGSLSDQWLPAHHESLASSALGCLELWAPLGPSLGELYRNHFALFCALLDLMLLRPPAAAVPGGNASGIAAAGVPLGALRLSGAACKAFNDVMGVREYPTTADRARAAETVLRALAERLPAVFAAAAAEDDDASCVSLVGAALNFASKELQLVTGPISPAVASGNGGGGTYGNLAGSGDGAGLALVEFLLACAGHPVRKVAILTLDFWLELQDVPVSERHPALGHPIYARLLTVLLRQCQHPRGAGDAAIANGGGAASGYVASDEDNDDDEAFWDFREGAQGVKDVLVVAYYLLRSAYLVSALDMARANAGSWQALEVAIFAVTAVAKEVRDWLQAPSGGNGAEGAEDKRISAGVIGSLLSELLRRQELSAHPLVLRGGCQMVCGFAALLPRKGAAGAGAAAGTDDLLVPALHYLMTGLRVPEARPRAAAALRAVCIACDKEVISRPPALSLVLMAPAAVAAAPGVQLEEKLLVTEGGVRALAQMARPQASPLLLRFCGPALHTLGSALTSPAPDTAQVSEDLQVLAQAVRFLDAPSSPSGGDGGDGGDGGLPHPSTELLRGLWPLLEACASRFGNDEQVMTHLFTLVGKMLTTLRGVLANQVHVPVLLEMVCNSFEANRFPCCLDCMSTAVEVYGGGALAGDGGGSGGGGSSSGGGAGGAGPNGVAAQFTAMLVRSCDLSFMQIQSVGGLSECPQLVRALFDLCQCCLVFCPPALARSDQLDKLLHCGSACLAASSLERDSTRAVLLFVGQLANQCSPSAANVATNPAAAAASHLGGGGVGATGWTPLDAAAFRAEAAAALARSGASLCALIFRALSGGAGSLLYPNLIDCLWAVVAAFSTSAHHPELARQWVFAALSDPEVCAALGPEDRQRVLDAVFRLAGESRQRFRAMMLDFAKICRHEMTQDGLLAYLM